MVGFTNISTKIDKKLLWAKKLDSFEREPFHEMAAFYRLSLARSVIEICFQKFGVILKIWIKIKFLTKK